MQRYSKILSIFLILLLSFSLFSCSKKTASSFTVLDSTDLLPFLSETNNISANYYSFSSQDYAAPEQKWIDDEFLPFFRSFLFDNDLIIPSNGDNDCSQFTLYAVTCANMLYFKQGKNRPAHIPIAAGQFHYLIGGAARHAIIFFVVQDKGNHKFKLVFIEPQTQQVIKLTQDDFDNCLGIRI